MNLLFILNVYCEYLEKEVVFFRAFCFLLDLTRFKAEISCGNCKQPDVKNL